ncbi:ATP-grasp domain-containing protein [Legionella drozanskii]|uniref:ATP-grasp domain-containing protein n=1 Tax=Legionella drozanskii LLAP-1 TaxID=1212489 RepID=A0A0W0SN88_9GAMM|nr:hypothetical protein [Legionella drozanskii]KTC84771.1 hypothetical protein Ldro_2935 [Legionella drozanskii LLAP-1]
MNIRNAVLILGYNNTRINDVKKIKETARIYLNAITILCKKSPTSEDKNVADYAIDVELDKKQENIDKVIAAIEALSVNVIALLPFSDPGTQLGSVLAAQMGLKGPDLTKIDSALNKYAFRKAEKNAKHLPMGYKPIRFEKIESYEALCKLHQELDKKLFLKPTSEGNSRGCINLSHYKDLNCAWSEVEQYLSDGVVGEQLITDSDEYSWDHVSGFSWVTEKKTTENQYSAEIQQIVPAPISQQKKELIANAGEFMASLAGYNSGACHNEIFYSSCSGTIRGVEPNLRPAGMRIWDLAALAFEDFDPWKEWVLWAAGKNLTQSSSSNFKQQCYAGIRMISSKKIGILQHLPFISPESLYSKC